MRKSTFNEFQNNSILFHIGNRKHSSEILHKQLKNIKDRKPETMSALALAKQALDANPNYVSQQYQQEQLWGFELQKAAKKLLSNPQLVSEVKRALANSN